MKIALRLGWIFLCLALAFTVRCANLRDVFFDGRIYFADGDCYARMTRARMVSEAPGVIVRHHDFENWPHGTSPHTTAPLDYLIAALRALLDAAFFVFGAAKTSVLHAQTLDLAGALVGPLLGVAGAMFLAFWFWRFRIRFGAAALFFYAISPVLVHGAALGRPDHQALLLFLLTIAGAAELALALLPTDVQSKPAVRRWGLVAGAAWALSLWVSLYEPLILLVAVLAIWAIANRPALLVRERMPGALLGLALLLAAFLLEGWRIAMPDAALRAAFSRWQQSIGELGSLDFRSPLLFAWLGWALLAAPMLLFLAGRTDPRARPLLALLAATFFLTLWQARWGCFLALVFTFSLPWQLPALRRTRLAAILFAISLWPVLREWDARLFPAAATRDAAAARRAELAALRDLSAALAGPNGGPFLAPWWLSPALAYWTGQPAVAGSSHQSLPGIVDTARFYLSTDAVSAAAILRARPVRWILADEPLRVIATSAALLAIPPPPVPLASLIFEHPEDAPPFLREEKTADTVRADGLRFYRLYEVDNAQLPP